jgi:hypothetical protein
MIKICFRNKIRAIFKIRFETKFERNSNFLAANYAVPAQANLDAILSVCALGPLG